MFSVHIVQQNDLGDLMRLYYQLTGMSQDEKAIRAAFSRIEGDDHYYLFGAYDENDRLIATASLTKCFDLTDDARDYYSLENFVVDEECRNQGAGRILICAIENFVREKDGRYINFTSSSERKAAHQFYEKMGYPKGYAFGFKKMF